LFVGQAATADTPSSILLKPAAVFTVDDAVTRPGWVVLGVFIRGRDRAF